MSEDPEKERGRPPRREPREGETKQKVLHARIPASLDRDLKAKASSLGISVSNLVRHVLTNTVDLVEDVLVDSANIAASAQALVGKNSRGGSRGAHPEHTRELNSASGPASAQSAPPPAPYGHSPHGQPGYAYPSPPAPGPILGWQELVLNINAVCDSCNTILPKGSKAALAVRDGFGPRVTHCLDCLPKLDETPQT